MYKSTLLHLRIPFAFYLSPIFLFAVSQHPFENLKNLLISFIAIHLFLYPAANGYNSYFDKDKGSIGGLKNPPSVKIELFYTSLVFDSIAIIIGLTISWQFALMLFVYGLESKAYSHPSIRLKKYAYVAAFVTSLFQGGLAYAMSYMGVHQVEFSDFLEPKVIYPALLCSVSFLGFYPLTQVYQHRQDRENREITISIKLGLRGTFLFCTAVFIVVDIGYYIYFTNEFSNIKLFLQFHLFLFPLIVYFIWWYWSVIVDPEKANFRNTMLFNAIASICTGCFFLFMTLGGF